MKPEECGENNRRETRLEFSGPLRGRTSTFVSTKMNVARSRSTTTLIQSSSRMAIRHPAVNRTDPFEYCERKNEAAGGDSPKRDAKVRLNSLQLFGRSFGGKTQKSARSYEKRFPSLGQGARDGSFQLFARMGQGVGAEWQRPLHMQNVFYRIKNALRAFFIR